MTADVKYNTNFLTHVFCKFDFADIDASEFSRIEDIFYKEIKDEFSGREVKEAVEHTTKFENGSAVINSINTPVFQYNKEQYKIQLLTKSISLECIKYTGFDSFMKYVNKILTALNNAGQITNFKRTGLRYINQVYIPSCTLTKLLSHFDNSLTAISSKFFKDEKCLARQIGQTILNRDGFKVIFNHGIFNPDFPSNIVRNEFVLDYDCFSDAIEYNEYQAIIEKMHLEIQNLFEKSVKQSLRIIMGAKT